MATKLDLANSQLIGFHHGKWHRTDIAGLIEEMGLTKSEWIKLKNEYPQNIDEEDFDEIEKHFGLKI